MRNPRSHLLPRRFRPRLQQPQRVRPGLHPEDLRPQGGSGGKEDAVQVAARGQFRAVGPQADLRQLIPRGHEAQKEGRMGRGEEDGHPFRGDQAVIAGLPVGLVGGPVLRRAGVGVDAVAQMAGEGWAPGLPAVLVDAPGRRWSAHIGGRASQDVRRLQMDGGLAGRGQFQPEPGAVGGGLPPPDGLQAGAPGGAVRFGQAESVGGPTDAVADDGGDVPEGRAVGPGEDRSVGRVRASFLHLLQSPAWKQPLCNGVDR